MSRRFPIAVWQDPEGSFTARVLDGVSACAIDRSLAEVRSQLKKYLVWLARQGEIGWPDFEDLTLRDHKVRIRPEYNNDGALYPVGVPFYLRVTCVHGRRKEGTLHCVIPTLNTGFSCQQDDPVDELVLESVQQALGKKTPQELSRELMPARIVLDAVHVREHEGTAKPSEAQFPALRAVADLLGRRRRGQRTPRALARQESVRQLAERLTNDKASLLLLGPGGVGKTTVLVDAIRQTERLASNAKPREDDAEPDNLSARRFWRTSGQRLIAGMRYLGQWEQRCEEVIEELAETDSVLCIDNLLELVRIGGRESGSSVAAFLLSYLERRELRIVAEATPAELDACRRLLPGLVDQLQIFPIREMPAADAREVLQALLLEGERNLKLTLDEGLADLVYRLFRRFQPYAAFPGRTAQFIRQMLDDLARTGVKQLAKSDVLRRFQRETGLPEIFLRDDLTLPFEEVQAHFNRAVLGQQSACQSATGVVMALKTGLNDPRRPLGVLLFCGPTGVGKTEMAKALARYLFGAGAMRDRLVRLDMSEYAGYGAAERLLISADGQVSDFIKRMRRQPFAVVLLDEIEKASGEVHDVLLGVLDEGRLTDRFGRTTTFQSAVIVMTSNLGAERSAALGFDNASQPNFERIATDTFRPEFYNRIDAVVTFQPLSRETIMALAERELRTIAQRDGFLKAGLRLRWSPVLLEYLATAGFDARYGARPLQRAIERLVIAPLSRWLLKPGPQRDADIILSVAPDGRIVVGDLGTSEK